jgi:hypothetical protein
MNIGKVIPENIRRCMPKETRAELGKAAMTNADAQAKIDGNREKQLQENIANLLRQRNIWFMRQRMDRKTTGTLGAPDFLFAINGRACAFEVKAQGCCATPEQVACHESMRANGWFVSVVCSEREALDEIQQLEAASG